jgi:glyoxylase-like metal-dependent hydrolase (beta-lactamase superfamily II)
LTIGFETANRVDAQLEAHSQDPSRVDFVVVSHLHFDHVGGLSMLPNSTLVVQRTEWQAAMAVANNADTVHLREDYDLGHPVLSVDGEHDVFGDGAVVCLPTPGHTVGHQSLRVRLATGQQVVLASDCCYFARTLDGGALPAFGHDLEEQRRSLARLRRLRDGGAVIIPGHDIKVVVRTPRTLGAM